MLVPDLVMAFTCTPLERPCVASKRLAMNSNSAIESRLNCGWPWPYAWICVTCWPSRLSWKFPVAPLVSTGVAPTSFERAPRREQRQRHPVSSEHRQLRHLPRVDVAAETRLRDIEQRCLAGDRDRLLHGGRRQLQIDHDLLSDQHLQAAAGDGGKAGQLHRQSVDAGTQRDPESATLARSPRETCFRTPREWP